MTTTDLHPEKIREIATPSAHERGWETHVTDHGAIYTLRFAAPLLDGYCYFCHEPWTGPIPWYKPDTQCRYCQRRYHIFGPTAWIISSPITILHADTYADTWRKIAPALIAFDTRCEKATAEATRVTHSLLQHTHTTALRDIQLGRFTPAPDEHTPGSVIQQGLDGPRLVTWRWAPHPGWHTTQWARLTITTTPIHTSQEQP